ncbi:hypothetical protein [Clavibacter nebraskensis]
MLTAPQRPQPAHLVDQDHGERLPRLPSTPRVDAQPENDAGTA